MIHANDIQPLQTKFFYKNNQLHYQILILASDHTKLYGEFNNYEAYTKAYDILQNTMIEKMSKIFS